MKASEFVVVSGKGLLSSWESSPGVHRFFASCCGSPIYKRDDAAPEVLGFRSGHLIPTLRGKPMCISWSAPKAPWVEINDGLPQDAGGVPFGVRD